MDNIDKNTIQNLKNMMDKGELDGLMSQISPDMIQNFSNMLNQNSNTNSNSTNPDNNGTNNGFDFSNIDINTMMKMKSILEKMNNSNDPRSNLLYSLKPYLREERKDKIDQYANLLNFANIADLLKNENKENKKNE